MSKRFSPKIRLIALVTALLFCVQDAAVAAPGVLRSAGASNHVITAPAIPDSIALIDEIYSSPDADKPVIYLVQDAHANASGQINLARTLEYLFTEESSIRYVFTEAGQRDNSLKFVRKYGSRALRNREGLRLLRKGHLHGEEYLNIISDKDFVIWGVEDMGLYQSAASSYGEIMDKREPYLDYLKILDSTADLLKARTYNPELLDFDAVYQRSLEPGGSLAEYVGYLLGSARRHRIDHEEFVHLAQWTDLLRMEERIDFEKANQEAAAAFELLPDPGDSSFASASAEDGVVSKVNTHGFDAPQARFLALKERLGDLSEYPNLKLYDAYMNHVKNLSFKDVLREKARLEERVLMDLARTDEEKRLLECSRQIAILSSMIGMRMNPDEFEAYLREKGRISLLAISGFLNRRIMDLDKYYEKAVFLKTGFDEVLRSAESFYRLTYLRDRHYVKEILGKMQDAKQSAAVLITGGFHTPHLKGLLKSKGVSFVVLSPQVTHETNWIVYERLLASQIDAGKTNKSKSGQQKEAPGSLRLLAHYYDEETMFDLLDSLGANQVQIKTEIHSLSPLNGQEQELSSVMAGSRVSGNEEDGVDEFGRLIGELIEEVDQMAAQAP
ncbi:MAG: hypothetical protein HQL11_04875, partial [Candidatus Omnitrophica bacterium]|nr:hypothetical protein [Candidatus Omnitrophota bacterium]